MEGRTFSIRGQVVDRVNTAAYAATDEEAGAWILNRGPVAWYEGMYRTDRRGFISPTGNKVEYHAICATGRSRRGTDQLFNSWVPGYGDHGCGWLAKGDRMILQ